MMSVFKRPKNYSTQNRQVILANKQTWMIPIWQITMGRGLQTRDSLQHPISLQQRLNVATEESLIQSRVAWCSDQMSKLEEPPLTEPHIMSVIFPTQFIRSTQSRTFKQTAVVKCTICKAGLLPDEMVARLNQSFHILHHTSIDEWLKVDEAGGMACPICKKNLKRVIVCSTMDEPHCKENLRAREFEIHGRLRYFMGESNGWFNTIESPQN